MSKLTRVPLSSAPGLILNNANIATIAGQTQCVCLRAAATHHQLRNFAALTEC